jgi:hypothetical protein
MVKEDKELMFEQHELTHKPGARLQYCTRVRWHSVVFVHELRHTNQEIKMFNFY